MSRNGGDDTVVDCSHFTLDESTNQLSFTANVDDYHNETYKPGVYEVELLGTALNSDGPIAEVTVVEFTLLAPEPDETIEPEVEVTEEEVTGDN